MFSKTTITLTLVLPTNNKEKYSMPVSSIKKKVSEEEAWFTTPTNGKYNLHDKNNKKEPIMLAPFIL